MSYRVIERLRRATVLEVQLDTGFKNQIRAQLAFIGHPLLGEQQYVKNKGYQFIDHQALHAWRLGFDRPGKRRIGLSSRRRHQRTSWDLCGVRDLS